MKSLYRSDTDKILGGVCGGLGEYFGIDSSIIRIIFVLFTIFGGSGVLIYLVLWLLVPAKSSGHKNNGEAMSDSVDEMKATFHNIAHDLHSNKNYGGRPLWALLLIAIGIIFLLNNFGLFDTFNIHDFWPVILIIIGLVIVFR